MSALTSSRGENASHSLVALADACREAEVNAELLHHAIEKQADEYYTMAHKLVRYTRWVGVLSVLSGITACVPLYYLNAQVYRVWRLRYPQRVRSYRMAAFAGGGFALTSFLFLISPVGFLHAHDRRWEQAHELDALAVQALCLRQDYTTLQYWSDVLRGVRVPLSAQAAATQGNAHEADLVGTAPALELSTSREDPLPWVRVTHPVAKQAEEVPVSGSKEEALAAALFKTSSSAPADAHRAKEEDEAKDNATVRVEPSVAPHTWTLEALQRGKKQFGAGWVENELWCVMEACMVANSTLIDARDATLRRSL